MQCSFSVVLIFLKEPSVLVLQTGRCGFEGSSLTESSFRDFLNSLPQAEPDYAHPARRFISRSVYRDIGP